MATAPIVINDYKLFKLLGKGSFGEVYLTSKTNNPKLLATKRIDIKSPKNQKMLSYLNYEISIMKELSHPNIIKLYDFIPTLNHYYVIMEYCNGGSLSDCLKKYGNPFPVKVIQYLMRQIIEGLIHIHSKSIVHRDIKLDNILVNFNTNDDLTKLNLLASEVKIIDFGLAKKLGPDGADTFIGTPFNMAPTILSGVKDNGEIGNVKKYSEKVDIWSLGTICYQMLTGNTLFQVTNMKELVQKVKSGQYSIPINLELSSELIYFLNSMLQQEENLRWSAKRLAEHPFLTKDVNEFTKLEIDKISDKIEGNELKMNAKNNSILKAVANNVSYIPYINPNNGNKTKIPTNFQENISGNVVRNKIGTSNMKYEQIKSFEGMNELEKVEKLLLNVNQKEIENKKKSKIPNPNNRFNKQNNALIQYIGGLLDEYNEARNYFSENNLKDLEQDAFTKSIEIEKALKLLESGKSINNSILPISPEYIYGYSSNERNKKFNKLLNYYKVCKHKIESEMKTYQKSNNKNNQIKLQKLNLIINELEKRYLNEWVPAPEYINENKQIKVEKISFVNCPIIIKIQVIKVDITNEQVNLMIYFKINEMKNLRKEIKLSGEHLFEEWSWTLNANEWGNIDINDDNFIFCINVGSTNIRQYNINKIIKGQNFTFDLSIPTQDKKNSAVNIKIVPIFQKGNKFVAFEEKQIIKIKKIFPAFTGKSSYTNKIPKKL